MDGEIKTYLPEKKYGFIKGNDGKDYYFHASEFKNKKDIPNICVEVFVEFDQKATPKGYKAVKCTLVDSSDVLSYVVPAHFLTSKTNQVKGWEIIEYGEWVVKSSARESADVARQEIIDNAQHVGAAVVISLVAILGGEPVAILIALGVAIYINYFWISFGEWLEKT